MSYEDDQQNRMRNAAYLISDLLCTIFMENESLKDLGKHPRHIPIWVKESVEWLREQWRNDPETPINSYTAQWVRGELDYNGQRIK